MTKIFTNAIVAIALLAATFAQAQTTYFAQSTTNLHLVANWNSAANGSGSAPTNFTAADQIFLIDNELTASIGANWSVSGTNSKIVVGDGVNAVVFSTGAFTVTGVVDVAAAATFNVQSSSAFTLGTCASGSTVSYSGDLAQSVRAGTYHHLVLTGATIAQNKTASGSITVNGNLTVDADNTLVLGANTLSGASGTISGTGSITATNIALPSGRTWTQSVAFISTASHNIPGGTFENLRISGSSDTRTATADITVNGVLQVDALMTLAMTTFQLSGTFTTTGTGTISSTRTPTPFPDGKTWTTTLNYAAAAAQNIASGTYNGGLTISGGGSNVKTATSNLSISGALTVASSTILNMSTFELSSIGSVANSGTIQTANVGTTAIPSGFSYGGTIAYNSTFPQTVVAATNYTNLNLSGGNRTLPAGTLSVSGTLTTGAGAINANGGTISLSGITQALTIAGQTSLTLNNLTILFNGVKTFSNTAANVTIGGNLTIPMGSTLAMGTNRLIVTNGTPALLGAGTLTTSNTSTTPFDSTLTWPYRVSFTSTSADFIPTGTYQSLTVSGGGTTSALGSITVADSFAMTGALNMGIHQLVAIGGPITNTNTLTTLYTGVGNAIPSGKTWPGTVTYAAAANQNVVDATSYNNLTISGGASAIKTAGANLSVIATLTVATTTILDMATFEVTATTIANTGTIRTQNTGANPLPSGISLGTVEYNSASAQNVVPGTYIGLNISGGDRTLDGTINVSGTLTSNSGAITGGTSEVRLTGTTQTISLGSTGAFNHFRTVAGTTKTITAGTGALTVNGDLEIASGTTLVMTTNQLLGAFTPSGTGTITTTCPTTTGDALPTGKTWTQTVTYLGSSVAQTIAGGTYPTLNITTGTDVNTADGNITIGNSGTLQVASNNTLDMGTNSLTIGTGATISGTGTIRTQNETATPITADQTWTQTILYNSTNAQTVVSGVYNVGLNIAGGDRTLANTGTIEVRGAFTANTASATYTTTGSTVLISGGAQTLTFDASANFAFNNLSFTVAAANTKTIAGGGFDVNGTLNIGADVTLNMVSFQLGGNPTTITGDGQLNTAATTAPIPNGESWPFVVNYNGAINQEVASGTYSTLSFTSTTATRLRTALGDITVNGSLNMNTTTGNQTFVLGTNRLINGGSFAINVSGTGTRNFTTNSTDASPVPAGVTWPTGVFTYDAAGGTPQTIISGIYSGLTLSGTALKNAAGNITVNGVLNLANTSSDNNRGYLEMTIAYGSYATGAYPGGGATPGAGVADNTSTLNNLNSHVLTLGPDATVTGTGDVTGKVRRSSIADGVTYAFNHTNTQLTFTTGTGSIPTQITVVATKGTQGSHVDKTNSVNQLYQVLRTGGTSGATMVIRLAYADAVLNGNTESNLVLWDHHIPYDGATPHEHGKTNQSTTQNYVELASHGVTYLATEADPAFTKYWMISNQLTAINTWVGAIPGGSWNILSNWSAGTLPTTSESVLIPDAATTAHDPNFVSDVTTGTIEIATGGVLNASTFNVTLTGGPLVNGGRGTWLNNGTFNAGSGTVIIDNNDATIAGTTTFNNLTINSTRLATIQNGATVNIGGTLTNSGTLAANAFNNTVEYSGASAQNIIQPNGASAGYRNLIISGAGDKTFPATTTIAGDFTNNASGAVDFTTNTNTTTFANASGANQTIAGSVTTPFNNLNINSNTGFEVNTTSNITVGGTLTVNANARFNPGASNTVGGAGTLTGAGRVMVTRTIGAADFNSQYPIATKTLTSLTVDYAGSAAQTINDLNYNNLTVSENGVRIVTLNNSGTIAVSGAFTADNTNTSYTTTGSTVDYSGSSQTIAVMNYDNLTLSNSGTKSTQANLVVQGTLATDASVTLDLGTSHTLSGTLATISNSGTISTAVPTATSSTPIPAGRTWGGTVVYAAAAGSQTVMSGTYNNLTLSNTSGSNDLSGNLEIDGLLSMSTGRLNLGSNDLTLDGNVFGMSASGSFTTDGTNDITIGGSGTIGTLFFDQTTPGLTNRIANLTYNRASQTITLGNQLQVTGVVTPTAGTLASAGNLRLISTASGTARIASGACASCSYISGDVITERFIPAKANRRWQFLSSPVTNGTLLGWQDDIFITGPTGQGFDVQNTSNSVFTYSESTTVNMNDGWVPATNINNPLTPGTGFRVFVRGDRTQSINATSQNAVTLNLVGPVNTGDLPISLSFTSQGGATQDGWHLVGNPYPSDYDFNAHWDALSPAQKAIVDPSISVYDASANGYKAFNCSTNVGALTGGIVPSGASFWVKINSATTLTFEEQFKANTQAINVFKSQENATFSIHMRLDDLNSDEVFVKYMTGSTSNADAYFDTRKMNGGVNISAYGSDGVQLSASVRPLTTANDTILLNVTGANGNYTFTFKNVDLIAVQENVWLIDNFTSQVVDLKNTTTYNFSITSNAASKGMNRFYLVVGNAGSLPVSMVSFTAKAVSKDAVKLDWKTAAEKNVSHFVIEKSTDGVNYAQLTTVDAVGNSANTNVYVHIDNNPALVNYYRLTVYDIDQTVSHSDVRMVNLSQFAGVNPIKLYPIPAGDKLTVENESEIAIVKTTVYNAMGMVVLTNESNDATVELNTSSLRPGVYFIEITDALGNTRKEKFSKH